VIRVVQCTVNAVPDHLANGVFEMKKLGLTLLGAAFFTSSAFAGTYIDDRGYKECERSLTKDFGDAGLTFERQYMVKRSAAERTFFINAYVWNEAGNRAQVSSTCVTTPNGRDILKLETDFGGHVVAEDILAAL
jgi:hypothetical protein